MVSRINRMFSSYASLSSRKLNTKQCNAIGFVGHQTTYIDSSETE